MSNTTRERTLWSIAIGVVLLYAVIPIIWIISLSLKKSTDIGDKEFLPIHGVSFDNYKSLFQTSDFTHALSTRSGSPRSRRSSHCSWPAMAAYALARLNFAGKAVILSGALAIAMFPAVSIVGSLFATWRSIGLFDTWPGLIIPYMTFSLPLAIYTLTAFFREIPFELEQAAEVDGATPMQAFRRVILPAGHARHLHRRRAGVHHRLERLPVRHRAHLDQRVAHRARHAGLLHRRIAVRRRDPADQRRGRRRDRAYHHPRSHLPAPHRRRPDRRRGEGLAEPPKRSPQMAEITLKDVTKRYPDGTEAVKHMNLDIADGEFMIFVGPSGCGKSTALRMIAGLEDISEGELRIGDEVVNQRAPKDRDIAMVFQNYALYPHMTVRDNMGFALKLAKVPKDEIDKKVEEAARILDLSDHLDRKPANLSGGQRQRVAMGRAIVRDPEGLPDGRAAVQPRREAARADAHAGLAHPERPGHHHGLRDPRPDRGDDARRPRRGACAAASCSRSTPPAELYEHPKNLFVAGFIGSPAMNFMSATVEGDKLKLPLGEVPLSERQRAAVGQGGGSLIVGLRPEHFEDAGVDRRQRARGVTFQTKIDVLESMGSEYYAYFHMEGRRTGSAELQELAADLGASDMAEEDMTQAVARLDIESRVREGETIELWFDPDQHAPVRRRRGRAAERRRCGPSSRRFSRTYDGPAPGPWPGRPRDRRAALESPRRGAGSSAGWAGPKEFWFDGANRDRTGDLLLAKRSLPGPPLAPQVRDL